MAEKKTTANSHTKKKETPNTPKKKGGFWKRLLLVVVLLVMILGLFFCLFILRPPILHKHNTLGTEDCIICDDSYHLQRIWGEGRLYRQKINGIKTANCYTLNWKGEVIQSSLPLDKAAIETIQNDTELKEKPVELDVDSILQAQLLQDEEYPEYKTTYSYKKKSMGRVWGLAYDECRLFEVYEITHITTRTFYLADFNFKTMGKTSKENTYSISELVIDVATGEIIPEGDAIALGDAISLNG